MTDPVDERAAIVAAGLTEAQRKYLLDDSDRGILGKTDPYDLCKIGLARPPQWQDCGYYRSTPLGLAVRAHLIAKDQTHD